jgi:hypothetical protein
MPENIIVTSCWVDWPHCKHYWDPGPNFLAPLMQELSMFESLTEFSNADSNHAKKLSSLSIHSFQDPSIFMFGSSRAVRINQIFLFEFQHFTSSQGT